MKHMHTPSHTFIAVRFDTTGSVLRKPLEVVKKFSMVVTPGLGVVERRFFSFRFVLFRIQVGRMTFPRMVDRVETGKRTDKTHIRDKYLMKSYASNAGRYCGSGDSVLWCHSASMVGLYGIECIVRSYFTYCWECSIE